MRRLIISIALVLGIVTLSICNLYTLHKARAELTAELDAMMSKAEISGPASVLEDARAFEALWLAREEQLIRFIRHSDLEQITWDSARLPYLAKYEDISELTAELSRIRLQINHLWETQLPRWRTVF